MERWRGALRELGEDAARVTWRYGAFELDPNVPRGGVDARAYLEGRYDAAMIDVAHQRLREAATEEGLAFNVEAARVRPNTFAAHRLLTAALGMGPGTQQALGDALFAAYWASGRDVGDPVVLADAAESAGLAPASIAGVLEGDEYAEAVRDEQRRAETLGVHAVPTFVFGGRLAVSGAQPSRVLAMGVRRALEAS